MKSKKVLDNSFQYDIIKVLRTVHDGRPHKDKDNEDRKSSDSTV